MRGPQERGTFNFIPWFLGVLVGVYVLQNILERWFGLGSYYDYTALSGAALRQGYAWTFLSYALFHGSLMHLLLNGLGIYFLGRTLTEQMGPARLAQLTVGAAIVSGLFWVGVNFGRSGQVVGASGIVMAYLMVFACLQPNRPMTFLIFFVIPLTIKPLWLVAILGGIDLLGFLFKELPAGQSGWIAHSAHLGGLAGGWLFYQFVIMRGIKGDAPLIQAPGWMRKSTARKPAYTVNLSGRSNPSATTATPAGSAGRQQLKNEVDRILDKINERGFGSLTAEEKRVLDEARQLLGPR